MSNELSFLQRINKEKRDETMIRKTADEAQNLIREEIGLTYLVEANTKPKEEAKSEHRQTKENLRQAQEGNPSNSENIPHPEIADTGGMNITPNTRLENAKQKSRKRKQELKARLAHKLKPKAPAPKPKAAPKPKQRATYHKKIVPPSPR